MIHMKKAWRITLIALLLMTALTPISNGNKAQTTSEKVFVGITFGGTTVDQAKQLIDRVKSYTNLLVVASWTIDGGPNGSALTDICDYAAAANMSFIVYFNFIFQNYTGNVGGRYNSTTWDDYGVTPWHRPWLDDAKARYGDKFLGAYLYDEPGGKQIDCGYWNRNNTTFAGTPITIYRNVSSYDDVARIYVSSIARSGSMQVLTNTSYRYNLDYTVPVFVSDYALFWFDYKAGYSTVFTEIGELHNESSKIKQIALCRGAADAMNKDWGAIITFESYNPPTPENGTTMINDMTMAYKAGAKYIVVFDYQVNGTDGLTNEQFDAMQQFWSNIHSANAPTQGESNGQVAYVLPTNYGWGMRTKNDNIWGFWPADNNSAQIWDNLNRLVDKYGLNLDIVYNDSNVNIQGLYSQTYLWNNTINFASTLTLTNEIYILISAVGSFGAVACVSTYWVTKRRKPKLSTPMVREFSPSKVILLEASTTIPKNVEVNPELNEIFNAYANIIDPLHDLLMDLHGHTSWIDLENDLTRCKLAKALEGKIFIENLNFRNLSTSIRNKKAREAGIEITILIEALHKNVSALKGRDVSKETQMDYDKLKSVILAYFTLNDILLGQALGDRELEKEKIELAKVLTVFSEKTGNGLFTEFTNRLKLQKNGKLSVDKSRAAIRKQLNEFLRQS